MFNVLYSLSGRIEEIMAELMKKYNLKVLRDDHLVVEVSNEFCRLKFTNVDNNFVRFEFFDTNDSDGYEFSDVYYLDLAIGSKREFKILLADEKMEREKKLVFYLEQYNHMLWLYFEKPLTGDFSWKEKYFARIDYIKKLKNVIYRNSNEITDEIVDKQLGGDKTWEDDALAYYNKLHPDEPMQAFE